MSPDAELRHLVAWGLMGGPTEPIEQVGADGLAALAEFHRVTGVVLAALDDGAAATPAHPDLVADLTTRHLRLLHQSLAAEADLVEVARRFDERGVDVRELKGCATAHLDHPDPALRITSDVDVLVRAESLARATAAVEELIDRVATVPDRRPSWTERYGKDRTLMLRSGGSLDLHRMAAPGYHGLVDDHDWFADPDPFEIAGTELAGCPPADRLVHALAHAAYSDHVRYHSIRDVPVLLATVGDGWRHAVERHVAWSALLARGVEVIWSRFDLASHPLVDWAADVRPGWRERQALRTFGLAGSRQHWGGLLAVQPWRWPGLLVPIAVPSREYLEYYGRTPAGHLRSAVTQVGRSGRQPPA